MLVLSPPPRRILRQFSLISSLMVSHRLLLRSFLEHTLQLRPEETRYQIHEDMQSGMCALETCRRRTPYSRILRVAPVLHVTPSLHPRLGSELRVKMLERALDGNACAPAGRRNPAIRPSPSVLAKRVSASTPGAPAGATLPFIGISSSARVALTGVESRPLTAEREATLPPSWPACSPPRGP